LQAPAADWVKALAEVAAAVAADKGVSAPVDVVAGDAAKAIARSLAGGERKAILLGNAAAHHAKASRLLALAQWIAGQTGTSVGYLTEAANTVGAQYANALPGANAQNAGQMLAGGLKAAILLNVEPQFDSAAGASGVKGLNACQMVVTLSPFKANLAFSDVLLPIAPFTETPGTFVNAEGRVQGFHAVVKPLGETRPGWKVLRVLANMLGLAGFDFESAQEVAAQVLGQAGEGATHLPAGVLSNAVADVALGAADLEPASGVPATASIYQLDGIVRRASSLQLTADARLAASARGVAA